MRSAGITAVLIGLVLAGCGESPNSPEDSGPVAETASIPRLSDEPQVQAAFVACVEETRAGLAEDNRDTPAEILTMIQEGALQTCESAVIRTCANGVDNGACRVMLDVYAS